MRQQYANLRLLLDACLVTTEFSNAAELFARLTEARRRRSLTFDEFLMVCHWKEPRQRARRHWLENSDKRVQRISAEALKARSERTRIKALLRLHGVGVPMASALLTAFDPDQYGIIDIRAWQVLVQYGEVSEHPDGIGMGVSDWLAYLSILRRYAAELGISVRTVERTLYDYHRTTSDQPLYRHHKSSGAVSL